MVPWAHPRSRGEHVPAVRFKLTGPGSSPLARGTLVLFLPLGFPIGLIPARAGNTWRACRFGFAGGAHPRSRGEHEIHGYVSPACAGSSPLARGTLILAGDFEGGFGLIPARAGNTPPFWRTSHRWRAHPRSRGEHCDSGCRCNSEQGSSPLARGTPLSARV